MHSFLITNWSGALEQLPEFIKSSLPRQVPPDTWHHPDILILEPNPSITISQIRQLKLWLSRRPYQAKNKLALILKAETLTLPAQHALLKSLEEPPENTTIILSTNHPNSLLLTIHSRCQLISIRSHRSDLSAVRSHSKGQIGSLRDLSLLTPGQRLALAGSYTTKDQALSFCRQLIHQKRSDLSAARNHRQKTDRTLKPSKDSQNLDMSQLARQLRLLQTTYTLLQKNINPRLAIEQLFLNL